MSPPKVPRFGRSRSDSQFRGIAEVVKEFMEYIADSPLLAHNAKFDIWLESGGLKGMGAPIG